MQVRNHGGLEQSGSGNGGWYKLTLEKQGFELHGSTYMRIFYSTVLYFPYDFLFSSFIVKIQYVIHITCKYVWIICIISGTFHQH